MIKSFRTDETEKIFLRQFTLRFPPSVGQPNESWRCWTPPKNWTIFEFLQETA